MKLIFATISFFFGGCFLLLAILGFYSPQVQIIDICNWIIGSIFAVIGWSTVLESDPLVHENYRPKIQKGEDFFA